MGLFSLLSSGSWYGAAGVLSFLALTLVHRLMLHPLSKYPGPFLAKVSDIYAGFYAGSMSLHIRTREDHLKYGPVMRYGPNRLIFNSKQALKDIYLNERLSKSHVYQHIPSGDYSSIFDVVDKSVHRYKRQLIGQAISERSMRIFHPTMTREINVLLQILASSSGQPINMTDRMKRLGMDLIGLLAIGYPLKTQTEDKYRFLIQAHVFGTFRSNMYLQFPFIKATGIYSMLERLATADVQRYFSAVEKMLEKRVSEAKDVRHDLYSLVADKMNPNGEHSINSEIWAEAAFFFPAGGETTATLLSATFFYLAYYSGVYGKLAEEIRSTFPSGDAIVAGSTLTSCRYLRACIDESLRISPPISGTLWRELAVDDASTAPLVIDGHVIPPGIEVGVNYYTIHHNEEYFPEPYAFKPERWLGSPGNDIKEMQEAWAPFSLGSRSCPGKAMAYQEASLVLAKVMWYFDFEFAPGSLGEAGRGSPRLGIGRARDAEFQLYEHIAATHEGPNLVFEPRAGVAQDFAEEC
ncbi:cytochrome P450 [Stachybotrys elegans]|uniref:Cytochrome P450 n=1 Tax=Stachybotrys elegans TaxID=80388 RepID=A0A8K0WNY2_9HYPO|nr:cytochrome P450 [Stachybotrys elegans]